MSSAPEDRRERPGSLVLVWNGSEYELHRAAVILEDPYLGHDLNFPRPTPPLLDIGATGAGAGWGLVGSGHIPHPAAASLMNTPSCGFLCLTRSLYKLG